MVFGTRSSDELQALKDVVAQQGELLQRLLKQQEKMSSDLSSQLSRLQDKQHVALTDFSNHVQEILALNARYGQSISSLKKVKSDLSELMYESALKETSALVQRSVQQLSSDFSAMQGLCGQFSLVRESVTGLQTEIAKVTRMSSSLKEIDAQLVNYVREITAQDKEKLELMREIDKLQTQIARMRRA